jgi:hypothetical protein
MATSGGSGLIEDSWETVDTKKKQPKPQSSESVSANKFALLPRPPPNLSVSKATNQFRSFAPKNHNEVTKERATTNMLRKEQPYAHPNQTSNTSVTMNTTREMPTGSVKKSAASIGITTKIVKNPSLTESSRVRLPTATYETKSKKIPEATVVPPAIPPTQKRIPQVPAQTVPITTEAVVSPAQTITKGISFFDMMKFPKKTIEIDTQSTKISALDTLNSRIKNKTGVIFHDNNHIKKKLDEKLEEHRFIPKKQKKKKLSVLKKKIFMV